MKSVPLDEKLFKHGQEIHGGFFINLLTNELGD